MKKTLGAWKTFRSNAAMNKRLQRERGPHGQGHCKEEGHRELPDA